MEQQQEITKLSKYDKFIVEDRKAKNTDKLTLEIIGIIRKENVLYASLRISRTKEKKTFVKNMNVEYEDIAKHFKVIEIVNMKK